VIVDVSVYFCFLFSFIFVFIILIIIVILFVIVINVMRKYLIILFLGLFSFIIIINNYSKSYYIIKDSNEKLSNNYKVDTSFAIFLKNTNNFYCYYKIKEHFAGLNSKILVEISKIMYLYKENCTFCSINNIFYNNNHHSCGNTIYPQMTLTGILDEHKLDYENIYDGCIKFGYNNIFDCVSDVHLQLFNFYDNHDERIIILQNNPIYFHLRLEDEKADQRKK